MKDDNYAIHLLESALHSTNGQLNNLKDLPLGYTLKNEQERNNIIKKLNLRKEQLTRALAHINE